LGDKRLNKRLEKTVETLSKDSESSILSGCGSKHEAKAFYRLLGNEKFTLEKIVKSGQTATKSRIASSGISRVLLPCDTSDINLDGHEKTKGLGYSSKTTKGIKIHNCLALTVDGTPLGLVSQRYETRESAKNTMNKSEKRERPIEEKESYRWLETAREALEVVPDGVEPVILCDREGDFYELYDELLKLKSSFIIRVAKDRRTDTNGNYCMQQIRLRKACGEIEIKIPRNAQENTKARTAKMETAYCSLSIKKPTQGVSKCLPECLTLNFVRITEISETSDEPIEWILATNMPVTTAEDAIQTVEYYVHRWKIERFHYILKSGCTVEKIQQRTYERILPVLFIYSVIAAFILSITYFARNSPDSPCSVFFDEHEWKILHRLIIRGKESPNEPYSIKTAVEFLGELGSFKHAPSDGDYGVKAVWKGLIELFDALDVIDRLVGQV
jgi:hypothetical protein